MLAFYGIFFWNVKYLYTYSFYNYVQDIKDLKLHVPETKICKTILSHLAMKAGALSIV